MGTQHRSCQTVTDSQERSLAPLISPPSCDYSKPLAPLHGLESVGPRTQAAWRSTGADSPLTAKH